MNITVTPSRTRVDLSIEEWENYQAILNTLRAIQASTSTPGWIRAMIRSATEQRQNGLQKKIA